jgi:hypothetical protein
MFCIRARLSRLRNTYVLCQGTALAGPYRTSAMRALAPEGTAFRRTAAHWRHLIGGFIAARVAALALEAIYLCLTTGG